MIWIDVRDGLPDYGVEVLVVVKYFDIPIQAYQKHGKWYASYIVTAVMKDHLTFNREIQSQSVLYWTPLPKIP